MEDRDKESGREIDSQGESIVPASHGLGLPSPMTDM